MKNVTGEYTEFSAVERNKELVWPVVLTHRVSGVEGQNFEKREG
jgi:hypothetical protein